LGEVIIIIHLWELPWFLLFFFFNFFLGALYTFKILSQVLQKKKNYFLSNSFEEKSGYLNSLIRSLHILPLFFIINFFFFF
jgi:hypothetical protein